MTNDDTPTHLKKRKPRLIERPEPEELVSILEAVLFVADAPIELAALSRTINAPKSEVSDALDDASARNLGLLAEQAHELISSHDAELEAVCGALSA